MRKPRGLLAGTASQIADYLEDWFTSGACDGFVLPPTTFPTTFEDFARTVTPELQRRGLLRREYAGRTAAREPRQSRMKGSLMSIRRRTLLAAALAAPALHTARAAPGNVLRIAIGTSLNTLDPMLATIGDEYIYNCLVFSGLTRIREDLKLEGDLAASWSTSDDIKTWIFKLRPGVKFHNGTVLVADDVVAFFQRMMDPKSTAPSRSQYDMIDTVSAPDASTIVFKLNIPYGGFADILADRQVKITPRGIDAAKTPIGTGPFKFVSYTPGDRLIMTKNPDYFEPGMPKLDGAELRVIPEMSVKVAALQAGVIDVVWDLPLDQVKDLSGNSALRVDSVPTASWDGAIMNNLIPPFNDKRVRQAFHLAVDKADVVELTLFGQGAETISPIPPSHPFYAKDIKVPKTDPAAAKKLLAEAGYPQGVKVTIVAPVGRPVRERLAVTLQQLAKPGGFDLQGAAHAVFQLQHRGIGQGAALHRRVLRPAHHRYQRLCLPAQQGELE